MDLKTSTYPRRHQRAFAALRTLIDQDSDGRVLKVANIGPGLAVKHLGRLAGRRSLVADIVRRIETGIRRLPMPDPCFENYETRELAAALNGLTFDLTVIDVNPRVVRIVQRSLGDRPVAGIVADLRAPSPPQLQPMAGAFDVVVAFAVVSRTGQGRGNAIDNIRGLVRPGGFLVGSGEFASGDYVAVEGVDNMFRRLPGVGST